METELKLSHRTVPVVLENGVLNRLAGEIGRAYTGRKIYLLTDANLERLYGNRIRGMLGEAGYQVHTDVQTPGEEAKSLAGLEAIYSHMLEAGMTRGDLLLVFGGGVCGDLGGFAAATYLRGISYIQVPTSLLAQVDSSIGGKVGVNLKEGKNLAGSFYHPERILIDPLVLSTLPEEEFRSGIGEVVKYACIGDAPLLGEIREYFREEPRDPARLFTLISCSAEQKIRVVSADEREGGVRMLLNFGHTLGHSIEKNMGYGRISHGAAVALGMLHFTRRSEALGLTVPGTAVALEEVLRLAGLPVILPDIPREDLLETIRSDKKSRGDSIRIILIRRIGEGFIHEVPLQDMEAFV